MKRGTPPELPPVQFYAGGASPLDDASPARVRSRRTPGLTLRSEAFVYWSMLVTTVGLGLFVLAMLRLANLSLPWSWVSMMATGTVPLLLAVGYCWKRGYRKLRDGLLMVVWGGVLSQLLIFPMYGAARSQFPLRDALFARIDAKLGLATPPLLAWLGHHHTIQAVLAYSYDALFPMMLAAAILPAMTGRLVAAREYVIGNVVSVLTAVPVFAVLPAIGPWIPYHLHPTLQQSMCTLTLEILRGPKLYHIDPYYTSGLICFPSFHVILAVLSTCALWSIRPLRPVALILCLMVTLSAITTGWHYSIDVLGGLAFSAVAITAAKTFTQFCRKLDEAPTKRLT